MKRKIELLDSTLREGEQTPNVSFSLEEKLDIASRVDEFGVSFIEAGHPAVSPRIKEAVEEIGVLELNADILAHSRALKEDVDAVIDCDIPWIGIFAGVNHYSLEHKLHCSFDEALERIEDGSYGRCETCGETIGARRLRVRPWATLCVECKRKEEDD